MHDRAISVMEVETKAQEYLQKAQKVMLDCQDHLQDALSWATAGKYLQPRPNPLYFDAKGFTFQL